jgi:apolipoprotein D and lipocalin family protein
MTMKRKNLYFNLILVTCCIFLIHACSTLPKGAVVVEPFDVNRYLGKWYEIARFDFRYERNMNNTTAQYALNEDGTIQVINRGYDTVKNQWEEATGKAKFAGEPKEARLKVSFFGPFYAPYNVIALDPDYRYALVAGKNLKYLWILSREKTIPDDIQKNYIKIAEEIGYPTSELLWVEHNQ